MCCTLWNSEICVAAEPLRGTEREQRQINCSGQMKDSKTLSWVLDWQPPRSKEKTLGFSGIMSSMHPFFFIRLFHTSEWTIPIDLKRGVAGKEGRTADATQLELSVLNEPRCLRDKEDKSVCVCVRCYPLIFPKGLTHSSGPFSQMKHSLLLCVL